MPVPEIRTVACASCGRMKGELNRWFLVGREGSMFCFMDYREHMLQHYEGAVCGKECLQKMVEKHADQLMAVHPAGRPK